jgi:hypothetical protein
VREGGGHFGVFFPVDGLEQVERTAGHLFRLLEFAEFDALECFLEQSGNLLALFGFLVWEARFLANTLSDLLSQN